MGLAPRHNDPDFNIGQIGLFHGLNRTRCQAPCFLGTYGGHLTENRPNAARWWLADRASLEQHSRVTRVIWMEPPGGLGQIWPICPAVGVEAKSPVKTYPTGNQDPKDRHDNHRWSSEALTLFRLMKPLAIVELSRKTIGPDGRLGRRTLGFDEVEATHAIHGARAPLDYRYHAFYSYLLESPSFLAVQARLRNEPSVHALPKDWKKIVSVARDFLDARDALPFLDWWRGGGVRVFATALPGTSAVTFAGQLSAENPVLRLTWGKSDAAVVRIGLKQPKAAALQQLTTLLDQFAFEEQFPLPAVPRYRFINSGVRRTTLEAGKSALLLRRQEDPKLPLWWIGNALNLIPTQSFNQDQHDRLLPEELTKRKQLLAVAASRLIRAAGFVAENAARGRFPCSAPFPEAHPSLVKRKAGRPPNDGDQQDKDTANIV